MMIAEPTVVGLGEACHFPAGVDTLYFEYRNDGRPKGLSLPGGREVKVRDLQDLVGTSLTKYHNSHFVFGNCASSEFVAAVLGDQKLHARAQGNGHNASFLSVTGGTERVAYSGKAYRRGGKFKIIGDMSARALDQLALYGPSDALWAKVADLLNQSGVKGFTARLDWLGRADNTRISDLLPRPARPEAFSPCRPVSGFSDDWRPEETPREGAVVEGAPLNDEELKVLCTVFGAEGLTAKVKYAHVDLWLTLRRQLREAKLDIRYACQGAVEDGLVQKLLAKWPLEHCSYWRWAMTATSLALQWSKHKQPKAVEEDVVAEAWSLLIAAARELGWPV
jgi:hypothetical protein